MTPITPRGDRDPGWRAPRGHRLVLRKWKSTFQTFRKDVLLTGHSMHPGAQTVFRERICCACHAKFGGHLPVPLAEAALPYWVPLSLRPQKQIPKMARFNVPKATKICLCLCHSFGGCLPMPRGQAVMPYWVPRALRSWKKVVKRHQSFKGRQERPLESCSWHRRWRICGDRRLLLKWQHLQALHQDKPLALGRAVHPRAPLLPFSLLILLQAILRAIMAIRQFFGV
ncbi:uncharacterized protein C16orf95 homolog isoform X2 [Castor canadensis]